jgi:hypothetical protein
MWSYNAFLGERRKRGRGIPVGSAKVSSMLEELAARRRSRLGDPVRSMGMVARQGLVGRGHER